MIGRCLYLLISQAFATYGSISRTYSEGLPPRTSAQQPQGLHSLASFPHTRSSGGWEPGVCSPFKSCLSYSPVFLGSVPRNQNHRWNHPRRAASLALSESSLITDDDTPCPTAAALPYCQRIPRPHSPPYPRSLHRHHQTRIRRTRRRLRCILIRHRPDH